MLLCIANDPELRLRDVAEKVGITERAVQRIVADLVEGRFLSRDRQGRRNSYQLHLNRKLQHPLVAHVPLRSLLDLAADLSRWEKGPQQPASSAQARPQRPNKKT
ncbi:MAG: helix-turn-helix domain-containing protein [Pirellulales bacterium]